MNDKYFCMAPWSHIQQNSYGEINPCCMFSGKDKVYTKKYDSLQDAFDGPENARLRQRMLNGEYIDSCKKCYRDEYLGKFSYRQRFNRRYDINEKPIIRELELALSNKCNFKCVTCNTRFSSSWYDDDKLLGRTHYTNIGRNYKSNFDIDSVDLSELVELKVLGGEPFLDDSYLKVFENIDLSKVVLYFVTNNSIFPSNEWLSYFKKFKKIKFNISLDGVYDVAEFVRYGTKFKRFEKNYLKWIELSKTKFKNITIIPHFVVHALNCLNITTTIDWLIKVYEKDYESVSNVIGIDFLEHPTELSLIYLPDNIKSFILRENENFLKPKLEKFMMMGEYDEKICNQFLKYCNFLNLRSDIPEDCKPILKMLK